MGSSFDQWLQYRRGHYFISPYKGRPMREGEVDLWQGDKGWQESACDVDKEDVEKDRKLYPYIFNDERDNS